MRMNPLNRQDKPLRYEAAILAAFVIGLHMRHDIDSKSLLKHSPMEIAKEANTELGKGESLVDPRDVVDAFSVLKGVVKD